MVLHKFAYNRVTVIMVWLNLHISLSTLHGFCYLIFRSTLSSLSPMQSNPSRLFPLICLGLTNHKVPYISTSTNHSAPSVCTLSNHNVPFVSTLTNHKITVNIHQNIDQSQGFTRYTAEYSCPSTG